MVLRRTGSGGGGLEILGMGKEADGTPFSRLLGEMAGRFRGGGDHGSWRTLAVITGFGGVVYYFSLATYRVGRWNMDRGSRRYK